MELNVNLNINADSAASGIKVLHCLRLWFGLGRSNMDLAIREYNEGQIASLYEAIDEEIRKHAASVKREDNATGADNALSDSAGVVGS